MNEKTARQIEEMKKQTIGVEVEMNSITRNKAAKVAADFSEQTDVRTPQEETDTLLGVHGMLKAENGNSKETAAFPDGKLKSANW